MKTINLLPKSRQKELFYEGILSRLLVVIWVTFFSFIAVVSVQVYAKVYMQTKLNFAKQEIDRLKTTVSNKENAETRNKLLALNALTADYKNLFVSNPKWSKVLEAFVQLPPDEIKVNSLVVNLNTKTVVVNGFSPTRDLVLDFYNAIKNDDKNFYNVDYPLQHIIKAKDLTYSFTFNIKDELLK